MSVCPKYSEYSYTNLYIEPQHKFTSTIGNKVFGFLLRNSEYKQIAIHIDENLYYDEFIKKYKDLSYENVIFTMQNMTLDISKFKSIWTMLLYDLECVNTMVKMLSESTEKYHDEIINIITSDVHGDLTCFLIPLVYTNLYKFTTEVTKNDLKIIIKSTGAFSKIIPIYIGDYIIDENLYYKIGLTSEYVRICDKIITNLVKIESENMYTEIKHGNLKSSPVLLSGNHDIWVTEEHELIYNLYFKLNDTLYYISHTYFRPELLNQDKLKFYDFYDHDIIKSSINGIETVFSIMKQPGSILGYNNILEHSLRLKSVDDCAVSDQIKYYAKGSLESGKRIFKDIDYNDKNIKTFVMLLGHDSNYMILNNLLVHDTALTFKNISALPNTEHIYDEVNIDIIEDDPFTYTTYFRDVALRPISNNVNMAVITGDTFIMSRYKRRTFEINNKFDKEDIPTFLEAESIINNVIIASNHINETDMINSYKTYVKNLVKFFKNLSDDEVLKIRSKIVPKYVRKYIYASDFLNKYTDESYTDGLIINKDMITKYDQKINKNIDDNLINLNLSSITHEPHFNKTNSNSLLDERYCITAEHLDNRMSSINEYRYAYITLNLHKLLESGFKVIIYGGHRELYDKFKYDYTDLNKLLDKYITDQTNWYKYLNKVYETDNIDYVRSLSLINCIAIDKDFLKTNNSTYLRKILFRLYLANYSTIRMLYSHENVCKYFNQQSEILISIGLSNLTKLELLHKSMTSYINNINYSIRTTAKDYIKDYAKIVDAIYDIKSYNSCLYSFYNNIDYKKYNIDDGNYDLNDYNFKYLTIDPENVIKDPPSFDIKITAKNIGIKGGCQDKLENKLIFYVYLLIIVLTVLIIIVVYYVVNYSNIKICTKSTTKF